MAVITKYVVVRNGVELDKEFLVKKDADAYDKMLDAAENLAAFIKAGELSIDLDDATIDHLSVFLAQNGPEVVRILKGMKPETPAPASASGDSDSDPLQPGPALARKKTPAAKTKSKDN